jgi:thioredoxin reductase (NADPH)
MRINDVVIIGAGPSGIASAIQLKRYGISPILIEKAEPGGLLKNANLVENYPGFPKGISGTDLIKLFREHLSKYSIDVVKDEVLKVDYKDNKFFIECRKKTYYSRTAVIASGTTPICYNDILISSQAKKKIYYEVYPIVNVKNCNIAIVGAGDAAFDYALNLSKYNNVVILNRGKGIKCLPLLFNRGIKSEKIKYFKNIKLERIDINKHKKLALICKEVPNKIVQFECDYILFAIGRENNCDFISTKLTKKIENLEKKGFLYFIGDVKNDIFRQSSIAIGNGIKAAMKIYRKLKGVTY